MAHGSMGIECRDATLSHQHTTHPLKSWQMLAGLQTSTPCTPPGLARVLDTAYSGRLLIAVQTVLAMACRSGPEQHSPVERAASKSGARRRGAVEPTQRRNHSRNRVHSGSPLSDSSPRNGSVKTRREKEEEETGSNKKEQWGLPCGDEGLD